MQGEAATNGILSRSAPEGMQAHPADADPLTGLTQGFVGGLPAERAGRPVPPPDSRGLKASFWEEPSFPDAWLCCRHCIPQPIEEK